MSRALQAWRVLSARGSGFLYYLVAGYLAPRLSRSLLFRITPGRLRKGLLTAGGLSLLVLTVLVGASQGPVPASALLTAILVLGVAVVGLKASLAGRFERSAVAPCAGQPGALLQWELWSMPEEVRAAALFKESDGGPLLLGRIDADGRLLSEVGRLPGFELVAPELFQRRDRFDLDLVVREGAVLLRKDFRGDRAALSREHSALQRLEGLSNVPVACGVDKRAAVLYRSYIPGETVNDLLVGQGARIRLSDTATDSSLQGLSEQERLGAVLARGRDLLPSCMSEQQLLMLEELVDRIHSRGVTGLSLTFGNVILHADKGEPWLCDFDGCRLHRSTTSSLFDYYRDQDRHKLNRLYDRRLVTERTAREMLARVSSRGYAPVDLGRGRASRGFWSIDSGTGRWEFLNRSAMLDLVRDRRVLDLGSHNGVMPLLMLRDGAREVVALERDPQMVDIARELKRLFEWRDFKRYALELVCADMREILRRELGPFDVVTAFCSLYYLEEQEMAQVVRRAAELAPLIVLQAKTDTRRRAVDGKALKSSLPFLERLLRENNFPQVRCLAPRRYPRPLLIGERRAALATAEGRS